MNLLMTFGSLPPRITSGRAGSGPPQRQITENDIGRTANEYLDKAGNKDSELTVDELMKIKGSYLNNPGC